MAVNVKAKPSGVATRSPAVELQGTIESLERDAKDRVVRVFISGIEVEVGAPRSVIRDKLEIGQAVNIKGVIRDGGLEADEVSTDSDPSEDRPSKFKLEGEIEEVRQDSDGTVVAYLWESSIDGELSTNEDFSSSDLSLGHHTITFRVQDNDEVWNSPASGGNGSGQGIQLWIYAVPVAIAGDDVSTTPNVLIQFNGQGTDEDGSIVKYEWDFDGNGVYDWSSSENGLTTYIYNNKGTYTVMLRVTDNDGFTGTDTVEIIISEKKVQIDDGNVIVTDAEEDEEGIPTLSVITTMAAVAVMALRRRPE